MRVKRKMAAIALLFAMVFQTNAFAAVPEHIPDQVVAVGRAVGIDVKCCGLLVVGFPEDSPAKDSGLHGAI